MRFTIHNFEWEKVNLIIYICIHNDLNKCIFILGNMKWRGILEYILIKN